MPSLPPGGELSVDDFDVNITSLPEDHAKNAASGDHSSGDREGGEDELVMILKRIRSGNVLREEEQAGRSFGRREEGSQSRQGGVIVPKSGDASSMEIPLVTSKYKHLSTCTVINCER